MDTPQELKSMKVTNELPVDLSMLSVLEKEFFSQNARPPEDQEHDFEDITEQ